MLTRAAAALFVVLLALAGLGCQAATVECGGRLPRTFPEEIAQKNWPSGFRPTPGQCFAGLLRGRIVGGDFERVRQFYRSNYKTLTIFYLQSPGGDVGESIAIGRLFRKYLTSAWAPDASSGSPVLNWGVDAVGHYTDGCSGPECICASACALIWFGAPDRLGTVGLHRPQLTDPEFKSMPPDQAMGVYRRALDSISSYLGEMEAPHPMIDAMVATGSTEIRWVDAGAEELQRAPSFAEWEDAVCGNFARGESDKMGQLIGESKRTANEDMLLDLLSAKSAKVYGCRNTLVYREVDKMTAP